MLLFRIPSPLPSSLRFSWVSNSLSLQIYFIGILVNAALMGSLTERWEVKHTHTHSHTLLLLTFHPPHCLLTLRVWHPPSSQHTHTLAGGWIGICHIPLTPSPPAPPPHPPAPTLFLGECIWLETNKGACWRLWTKARPASYLHMNVNTYFVTCLLWTTFSSDMMSVERCKCVCAHRKGETLLLNLLNRKEVESNFSPLRQYFDKYFTSRLKIFSPYIVSLVMLC